MSKNHKTPIGSRFGKLLLLEELPKRKENRLFLCVCDCGTRKQVQWSNLLSGGSRSCGCVAREKAKARTGKNNVNWKGDDVGYAALHGWVHRRLTKPDKCEHCGKEKKLDLANKSQEYKRDLNDWEWLCRSCHFAQDGRIDRIKAASRKNIPKGSSNYKGVSWKKNDNKWRSQIVHNNKSYHLGLFLSEEDAAIFYNVAAQLLHGESAYLNNV